MPTNPSSGKRFTLLKEKATGNHALDADAYGPVPHLFFNLALEYDVPTELLLTLLFLWDRTVGTGDDCGDCAQSQILVRDERAKKRWLAAIITAGFFEYTPPKLGGKNQRGAFYVYANPPVEAWEAFFRAAGLARHFEGDDNLTKEQFGRLFANVWENRPEPPPNARSKP